MNHTLRSFGLRVRTARKAANLTIEKASERADLNPAFLGQIERGEKRPPFETILGLSAALGVAPIVFFQFDKAETDATVLRQRIEKMLESLNSRQLLEAYRILRAIVEP